MLTNNNNKPNTSTKAPEIVPVSVVSNAAVTTTSTAGTSSTFRLPMTTDYFATAAANTMQMTTVQNQLVKFMGPATDPLSFFDTSTEGGHIVTNLFYPHGEQGRQHFLQDIRRTKDPIASIRKIIALECTIQATTRTIQSRETFIKSLLYNKEFQAPWYADLLRQQSNALGSAKNLLSFTKETSRQAQRVFHDSYFITKRVFLPTNSRELTKKLIKNIVDHHGERVAKSPTNEIARIFALFAKNDVMDLTRTTVYQIVQYLGSIYMSNQYLCANVRYHKKMGHLKKDFPEGHVVPYSKVSLSSLRWMVMIYLNIPFEMSDGCPPFEVNELEAEHPLVWNTTVKTPVPVLTKIKSPIVPSNTQSGEKPLARSVTGSDCTVLLKKRKIHHGSIMALPMAHVRADSNASLTQAVIEADNLLRQQQDKENESLPVLPALGGDKYVLKSPQSTFVSNPLGKAAASALAPAEGAVTWG